MKTLSQNDAIEYVFAGRIHTEDGYCEIPTGLFATTLDLLKPGLPDPAFYTLKNNEMEQIKPEQGECSFLELSALPSIWVKKADLPEIQKYAELILKTVVLDSPKAAEKRVQILQKTAMRTVETLFEDPSEENINRSTKVVASFVYLLMKEPQSFLLLSKLSNHDPYTLRHSVGTAVNAIILAKKFGFSDEATLNEIGLAGLLHDIGKTKVRREVINKNGPLDPTEWEEMQQHAQAGYEIIKNHPGLTDRVKRAVWEHHEDKNGTGYPQKLKFEDVTLFARIVNISDIFNALTTDRPYSKARSPYDAFQLMKASLSHKFDEKLFMQLVRIYGGEIN